MSWQKDVYGYLRTEPDKWCVVGELYDQFNRLIPLHIAMRAAVKEYGPDKISGDKARWIAFVRGLAHMGLERVNAQRQSGSWRWLYTDRVRLGYLPDKVCPKCQGRVTRGGWHYATMKIHCSRCRAPKEGPLETDPPAPRRASQFSLLCDDLKRRSDDNIRAETDQREQSG